MSIMYSYIYIVCGPLFFVGRYGLNVLCPGVSSHWLEEQTTLVGMACIKVLSKDVSDNEVPQHPRLDLN
jgi:hypothetical protein